MKDIAGVDIGLSLNSIELSLKANYLTLVNISGSLYLKITCVHDKAKCLLIHAAVMTAAASSSD